MFILLKIAILNKKFKSKIYNRYNNKRLFQIVHTWFAHKEKKLNGFIILYNFY